MVDLYRGYVNRLGRVTFFDGAIGAADCGCAFNLGNGWLVVEREDDGE